MFSSNSGFDSNTVFKPVSDIVSRQNQDGTIVIMKLDGDNVFYKINGVAAEIWSQFPENQSIGNIIKDLSKRYNVDETKIYQDSEAFLKELVNLNLVSKN